MNRIFPCISVIVLSCCAVAAQNPAAGAAQATPQPGVTSTESPEVQQFQKIENEWTVAMNKRDQFGLELVLSPLFLDVSATGNITTRNQQVAQLITDDDKTFYLTQKVITVRLMGDIAVVNGTYTLQHRVNSSEVDEKGIFTHVFERVRGNWLCVNSQRTAVNEGTKTKSKKSSTAELPFHFPIFGRSDKQDK